MRQLFVITVVIFLAAAIASGQEQGERRDPKAGPLSRPSGNWITNAFKHRSTRMRRR